MVTEVAVGILQRADGQVLLAQRPAGKPYEGWWEFPGGKCEANETPASALDRELLEELGVQVQHKRAWLVQDFVYPHATVQLYFFLVTQWVGVPASNEGQALAWSHTAQIDLAPLLPASIAVVQWLSWPRFVPLSGLAASPVNPQSCLLVDDLIEPSRLTELAMQSRQPIYIRGVDPHTGEAGYLSSLIWPKA